MLHKLELEQGDKIQIVASHQQMVALFFATEGLTKTEIDLLRLRLRPEEMTRCTRFLKDVDYRDYIAAHALLLWAIDCPSAFPAINELRQNHISRTTANSYAQKSLLKTNLSHTQGMVACALTSQFGQIGIDCEAIRDDFNYLECDILSSAQLSWIAKQEKHRRSEAFYRIWTMKEAILKARGVGLIDGVSDIEVPLRPLNFNCYPVQFGCWKLWSYQPKQRFIAAIALNDGPS